MTPVNRNSLRDFLSQHIQDGGLVDRLMGLLELIFQWVESGRYHLSPKDLLDPEKVRAAIALATGQEVARIVFVSHECLFFPKPPWMTEEEYRKSWGSALKNNRLRDSLEASLWAGLRPRLRASLRAGLGASRKDSLWAGLGYDLKCNLTLNLRYRLQRSLWAGLGASTRYCHADSIRESLFYLLGFAIAGRTDQVERLIPLIKLLSRAIPLGVKKDEPGVWVVLVA